MPPEKLKRITAGEYTSVDGKFWIIHDPGRFDGLPDSWLLCEAGTREAYLERFACLTDVRWALPRWRRELAKEER